MKQNTFEPCKDHENGHFGWCLLCENDQLRKEVVRLKKYEDFVTILYKHFKEQVEKLFE